MFRYRRYRVFLVFAVFAVFALYKFSTSSTSWTEQAANTFKHDKGEHGGPAPLNWQPTPGVAQETKKFEVDLAAAKTPQPKQTPPPIAPVSRPVDKKPETTPAPQKPAAIPPQVDTPIENKDKNDTLGEIGDVWAALSSSKVVVHWSKQTEHYPVPTESLITLPSGKAKSLPKIQFKFKKESPADKAEREAKLEVIRSVFKRSWKGYKEHAWLEDELRPVTGGSKSPFAGWRATLVDALDTLWIMGLEEEFAEAAKAVDTIDFTTADRPDIPLFETTIRYLGGLIAAYDISGKKYKNLLDKAVELAEVLLSAFDTPNRMPEMYYYWQPDVSSSAHRASNRVVLAEIGSLSVEFTRLAQLTGKQKYYDAIARITDNLEEFQNNTRLPGMWPTYLDASGCKRIDWTAPVNAPQKPLPGDEPVVKDAEEPTEKNPEGIVEKGPETPTPTNGEKLSPGGHKYIPLKLPDPVILTPNGPNPTWKPPKETFVWDINVPLQGFEKRQLDFEEAVPSPEEANPTIAVEPEPIETGPVCEEQGFASSSELGTEEYTLGGMSDSTYEYLPKQYILLGGRVEKYLNMFEKSIDVVKKNLLFRPMIPNGEDILFSGKLHVPATPAAPGEKVGELEAENAHLTCFAGGMFGLSAKLLDRPKDLEIARKLTDGCVWSYAMTATGIMPEAFTAVACESVEHCAWNETKYHLAVDPHSEQRLEHYKEAMILYKEQMAVASSRYEAELRELESPTPTPTPLAGDVGDGAFVAVPTQTAVVDRLDKRQLSDPDSPEPAVPNISPAPPGAPQDKETKTADKPENAEITPPTKIQPSEVESPLPSKTLPQFPMVYSPKVALSHEEFVKNRIQEDRLPPGVATIGSKNYILRPEAIESVWYMYRITGDPYWRQAGWRMFEAVNAATAAEFGNSAIDDVTKTSPVLEDSMESFWLAETLKYFYLLFEGEDVISLDEWVLNTEAHPFRREV